MADHFIPAGGARGDPGRGTAAPPSTLRRRVPAVADCATILRRALGAWLRDLGVAADLVDSIVLAAYEAMINVVTHAYRDRSGVLDLLAEVVDDVITVTVADNGRWEPGTTRPSPGGGRGLMLIRGLSEKASVVSTDRGTTVRMSWPGRVSSTGETSED